MKEKPEHVSKFTTTEEQFRFGFEKKIRINALIEMADCIKATDVQYSENGVADVAATLNKLVETIEQRIEELNKKRLGAQKDQQLVTHQIKRSPD